MTIRARRVVLWGGRRGDVQYNSRDFWRRTIPIDPAVHRMTVESTVYFDVGDALLINAVEMAHVAGIESSSVFGLR